MEKIDNQKVSVAGWSGPLSWATSLEVGALLEVISWQSAQSG